MSRQTPSSHLHLVSEGPIISLKFVQFFYLESRAFKQAHEPKACISKEIVRAHVLLVEERRAQPQSRRRLQNAKSSRRTSAGFATCSKTWVQTMRSNRQSSTGSDARSPL